MALDFTSIQAEAIQSPGNSGNGTADLAIDGDPSYSEDKCPSTTIGSNPFLRVDLKRPHLVKWVSVKFYGAGGNKTSVQVGSNLLDAGNYQCGNVLSYQTNSEDFYNFTCGEAQLGQYVIVTRTDMAPLQVCEIQVFTGIMCTLALTRFLFYCSCCLPLIRFDFGYLSAGLNYGSFTVVCRLGSVEGS